MRIHYPKLRNMTKTLSLSVFIAFKGFNFSVLFAITAAGFLPVHHPWCRLYFTSWSFEINGNSLRI